MPISVRCTACGTGHQAPNRAAGKAVPCLKCHSLMVVPVPEESSADEQLQDEVAAPDAAEHSLPVEEPPSTPGSSPRPRKRSWTPDVASLPPLTSNEPPFWRRHLHWVLVLALIPLIVS